MFPTFLAAAGCLSGPARSTTRPPMTGVSCLNFRGVRGKGELVFKGAAVAQFTAYIDAAVMFFHDAAPERQSQAGAVAARRVEGAENLRKLLFGNAAPRIVDGDAGAVVVRSDDHSHRSSAID